MLITNLWIASWAEGQVGPVSVYPRLCASIAIGSVSKRSFFFHPNMDALCNHHAHPPPPPLRKHDCLLLTVLNRAVIQEQQLCRAALPQWAACWLSLTGKAPARLLWLPHSMGMQRKPLPPPPASNWDVQTLHAEPAEVRRLSVAKGETAGKAPAMPQTVLLLSLCWLSVCMGHLGAPVKI